MLFTKTISVEFGPHSADWWMVGVSALAAAASLVLALFAWRTSRDAKKQAAAAELGRQEEAIAAQTRRDFELEDQRQFEYELKLDDALVDLFHTIASYIDKVASFLDRCEEVEMRGYLNAQGDLLYPPNPSLEPIRTSMEVVRLRAKNDPQLYAELDSKLESLLAAPVRQHPKLLGRFVKHVREYRSGVISSDALLEQLGSHVGS